jgi:uncharacterized alpha-E superfamily protein
MTTSSPDAPASLARLANADGSKFSLTRPPRPMLARDADSMYWMSRYVERAEHVARILLVNSNLLIDVGDLDEDLQERQWASILTIVHLQAAPPPGDGAMGGRLPRYMAFDPENPSSLYTCVARARENARGIRETISAEMWENLNTLYWSVRVEDAQARFDEAPDEFYKQVMTGSMLFQGLTDQTMAHDQRWLFAQLAKYLERIDVTARLIQTKFDILRTAEPLETPIRNIHWMAVLRSCCSIEAYRRQHIGDMDPLRVSAFLILEPDYPRSIRFAVTQAHEAIGRIRAEVNPRAIDAAERVLGRLRAQLEYAELGEILAHGLPTYLQRIQDAATEAALAVQKAYFLH